MPLPFPELGFGVELARFDHLAFDATMLLEASYFPGAALALGVTYH